MIAARQKWPCGRALVASAFVAGCGNAPSYSTPNRSAPARTVPVFTSTDAVVGQTLALGAFKDELCVVAAILGRLHTYETDAGVGSDSGADLQTGVSLYLGGSGQWQLTAEGNLQATAVCVPWSAFGVTEPALAEVETAGAASGADVSATGLSGPPACFLSHLEGSFDAANAEARVDGARLSVSQPSGGTGWAAATCFSASIANPYQDFSIDATGGLLQIAHVPTPDQALCGLSQVAAMSADESSVAVKGGVAIVDHAQITVRCFSYYAPSDN